MILAVQNSIASASKRGRTTKKGETMYAYSNNYHNTVTRSVKSPGELAEIEGRLAQGKASNAELALVRRMRRLLRSQGV